MILIADSGSTKTHWCVIKNGKEFKQVYTKGINPFYQNENEIRHELEMHLIPEVTNLSITKIFFYGAGCSFPEKKAIVSNAIGKLFSNVIIEVQSDLLAAARSLYGDNKGIACILGTGSNSCFYDGKTITENVSPLGYILGDEGSGAVLGKKLVADCLKNQLPTDLKNKLLKEYTLTPELILENVYKKPFPNRFLAKLTPFLLENIDQPGVYNIVYDSFNEFFKRNIKQYTLKDNSVSFIGSIAFYFKDILMKVAEENGVSILKIEQSPMNGLVEFHSKINF